jgi:hypothetical protein
MFPDANKLRDTLADCYHTIANLVADGRHLTLNKEGSGQHWKPKRRVYEQTQGRFIGVGTAALWHITNFLQLIALAKKLKCPIGWACVKRFFSVKKQMKLAEKLAMCGDRGRYFFGTTSPTSSLSPSSCLSLYLSL